MVIESPNIRKIKLVIDRWLFKADRETVDPNLFWHMVQVLCILEWADSGKEVPDHIRESSMRSRREGVIPKAK